VYLHPTGQIPAYEWNFSDVNPPVHAFATIFLYRTEHALHGRSDFDFLKRLFGKLTANFGWWVNRKDRSGNNLYEGGFLGLDNIGVFDRSAPLPTGGYLEQADGTAWVALFCENMLEIACELAAHDPAYEDLAANYVLQFVLIARSLNVFGAEGMWDEEDGFSPPSARSREEHARENAALAQKAAIAHDRCGWTESEGNGQKRALSSIWAPISLSGSRNKPEGRGDGPGRSRRKLLFLVEIDADQSTVVLAEYFSLGSHAQRGWGYLRARFANLPTQSNILREYEICK
jgi:hypothetical protein